MEVVREVLCRLAATGFSGSVVNETGIDYRDFDNMWTDVVIFKSWRRRSF